MESRVNQGHTDQKVTLDEMAILVFRDLRVLQVHQEIEALLVQLDRQVFL